MAHSGSVHRGGEGIDGHGRQWAHARDRLLSPRHVSFPSQLLDLARPCIDARRLSSEERRVGLACSSRRFWHVSVWHIQDLSIVEAKASMATAGSGPTPGIVCYHRATSVSPASSLILLVRALMRAV